MTSSAIVVRQATPSDLPGAAAVILDTLYHHFGSGFYPAWHQDLLDLTGTYLDQPDHALFVADARGEAGIVATAAIRSDGPRTPPHPPELSARFASEASAQMFRVYVRPEYRRLGLAGRLVDAALDFARSRPCYEEVYLHTTVSPGVESAVPFWDRRAERFLDCRDSDGHGTVHFLVRLQAGAP